MPDQGNSIISTTAAGSQSVPGCFSGIHRFAKLVLRKKCVSGKDFLFPAQ
jgi:hypothetical protein